MVAGRQAQRPKKKSDELSGVIQCLLDGLAAKLLALLPGTRIGPKWNAELFIRSLTARLEREQKERFGMIPVVKEKLLEAKKGLIVGIANEYSIAWGCNKAFRALGAELAVTYLNDKAKKFVEPLAREVEAPIVMPLDVRVPGQMDAVFDRISKDWGKLDFLVHSIAFSPKEALQGRVVDVPRDGFLTTMEVSCWTFMRMAHLAEPLMS
jgi:enoyl-[acyl-carrier protein] reductase I